jgi:hypothetical protein
VLLLLVVAFWVGEDQRGHRALGRELARLKAVGAPLSWEELAPHESPPEENFGAAAPLLGIGVDASVREALRVACLSSVKGVGMPANPEDPLDVSGLKKLLENERLLGFPGKSENAAQEILDAWNAVHGQFFEQLESAVDRPRSEIDPPLQQRVTSADPWNVDSSGLIALMSLSKALAIRTFLAIETDNAALTYSSLRVMFRLSELAADHPSIVGGLVANTMDFMAVAALQRAASSSLLADSDWAQLDAALHRVDARCRAERHLAGERIFALLYAADMRDHRGKYVGNLRAMISFGGGLAIASKFPEVLRDALEMGAVYLAPGGWFDQLAVEAATWNSAVIDSLAIRGWEGALITASSLEADTKSFRYRFRPHRLLDQTAAFTSGPVRAFAHSAALYELARCAVALERHRLANGTYPERLDDLVPRFIVAIPADLDGKPLRYTKTSGDEYILYSVGPDLIDDGGAALKTSKSRLAAKAPGTDIVWRCSAP